MSVVTDQSSEAAFEDDFVVLDLADLLPDEAGDVVLFSGDELPVSISAHEAVTGHGVADSHVTATGVDVTGLNFYSFESGITIYSLSDVSITEA
jgi:hypothetical protein